MSRCYPFPPPGYVWNKIRDECLIESIKGIKDEVKKDRKHRNKDKKRKQRENEPGRSKKHSHKRRRKDGGTNGSRESPNSEKSCLTVELEFQKTPQISSDSTLHSNERPKQIQSQPLDGRHNDSGEFVCVYLLGLFLHDGDILSSNCCYGFKESSIQIWLHGKGQKDPEAEVMMTNKDQKQCERLDASQVATRDALRVCQEKRRDPIFGSSRKPTSKEKKMPSSSSSCMHSEQEKPSSSHQEIIGPSKRLCKKCPPSMSTQFLNLIENWAPDRVESKLTDPEDQEWWLFIKLGTKRQQVSNQKTIQGSSLMVWPKARFLPEAEVHALPFAVPF